MKLKKIVALLTVAAMTTGLVACGGGNSNKKTDNKKTDADSYDWSAGADSSGGKVTLRYSTWREHDKEYYEELISRFEEKYDWITVDLEINSNESSYYNNLQADLLSGTAVDIFDCHSGSRINDYAEAGMIVPQADFSYLDNYSDIALAATSIDGVNYGYLTAHSYFGFIYNKAAFAKAGVSVPTTPEELVTVVNKLKAAGYGGVMVAGTTWSENFGRAILMNAIGTQGYKSLLESLDNGSVTDISEVDGVTDALKAMQLYADEGIFYQGFEGTNSTAGMSLFAQEKTAIVYAGCYTFGEQEYNFPGLDCGFFPMPTYANTGISYGEGAQTVLINSTCENLGAAKLFVEFISTPESSGYYCSNAMMLSNIEGAEVQFDKKEEISQYVTEVAIRPLFNHKNESYWSSGLSTLLKGVIYEGSNWEDIVKVYRSQLEEYDLANN